MCTPTVNLLHDALGLRDDVVFFNINIIDTQRRSSISNPAHFPPLYQRPSYASCTFVPTTNYDPPIATFARNPRSSLRFHHSCVPIINPPEARNLLFTLS
ncbi:hypothetical protein OG21DRAFT_164621 [Imleria badia]|nr:hypothetical protein OG21DRAFT_164621 [Imleria badia]